MGSAKLQIISYGNVELALNKKPEITYFKFLFKRFTNFAVESMIQTSNINAEFGTRVTFTLSKIADLFKDVYININLPPIGKFLDVQTESGDGNSKISKCAWGDSVGFRIIKKIEFEVGDKVIATTYGHFLKTKYDTILTDDKKKILDKMIGNVPELTDFTSEKPGYLLTVPIGMFFSEYSVNSFPIGACGEDVTVNLNIEFNNLNECLILGPSHYIVVEEDICLFELGDILYQNVNNVFNYFKFVHFDVYNKRLYYIKITEEDITNTNIIYNIKNESYFVTPTNINGFIERLYYNKNKYFSQTVNLSLGETYLIVDFIFLDLKEKQKFKSSKLTYIVEDLEFDNDKVIFHSNGQIKLNYFSPSKELIIICFYNYLASGYLKDVFNYTTDVTRTKELINNIQMFMNGKDIMNKQSMYFFNLLQTYVFRNVTIPMGIALIPFSLYPNDIQPGGFCNFSQIPETELKFNIDKKVTNSRYVKFRVYSRTLKMIVVENGDVSVVF